jgi:superfamily II DNA or RNA helicase
VIRAPGDLDAQLGTTAFRQPFRPYQRLALDAFERARAAGDDRIYLTLPPGSGKTVLGLESARRLGRPGVVLAPTTPIVSQWLAEWSGFEPPAVAASSDPDLGSPITVLTYQAVAVVGHDDDQASDPSTGADGDAAGRRRRVARGGDREAVLGLLHANGRRIVDRIAAGGPVTLILDECHHLLDLWGHVLDAVVAGLPAGSHVIGLTATPPRELGRREAALFRRLFGGHADFEIVTPAVVKDGHLAPYAELALLVQPTDHEDAWIEKEQERFDRVLEDLLDPAFATVPFGAWFATRLLRRETATGAPVAWSTVERDDPDLARAAIRRLWAMGEPPPPGAHQREEHRRAPDAADWIALLDGYVRDVLDPSAERVDRIALDQVRRALPAVGYVLTRRGVRRATSVVDRVLGVSAAKAAAAARIVSAESAALGADLRAVVICDFESVGATGRASAEGVLDPLAGSAAGALRALLEDPATASLEPVLVTGRTVACSRSTALRLVDWARADPELGPAFAGPAVRERADEIDGPGLGWGDIVEIAPDGVRWTSRRWVPLVTAAFEAGVTRCLVGTRALLGEGWNSTSANVLVDLGAATTGVSMQQVRGRTLRLDPQRPDKVAHNWDVVCVAEGRLRGDADYARFARKHRHYFALGPTGDVESGVAHVDAGLSPFGPPPVAEHEALNARMLARTTDRASTRAAWRIGEPYRDVPVETLRIRVGRSPGLPERAPHADRDPSRGPRPLAWLAGGVLLGGAALAIAAAAGLPVVGVAVAATTGSGGTIEALRRSREELALLGTADTLEAMAIALADGLRDAGLTNGAGGAAAVGVAAQPDGYYRCHLEGVPSDVAERFATALDELVAPLWDPRWIIARRVEPMPTGLGETAALAIRRLAQGRGAPLAWHAVPSILARRRESVSAFEAAWRRHVSPTALAVPATDPVAQAVLATRAGDDPFRTETQLRTLWT